VHELFEHGIEMAILTRTGKLVGQITSPATKNIFLRIEQFRKHDDPAFRLQFSKACVNAKVRNCLALIRQFAQNHPETDLAQPAVGLESTLAEIARAGSLASLLGIEGAAARHYFGALGRMVRREFSFEGRVKHPATDPVNALLSFGYTLLLNEISSLLDGMGFDPYLGFYHEPDYGRPSLGCDLQEEFRPVIDRFTLALVNNSMLKTEDFYSNPQTGGVYLQRDAMKRYFAAYEERMNLKASDGGPSIRQNIRVQIERLARTLKGEEDYQPFSMEAG